MTRAAGSPARSRSSASSGLSYNQVAVFYRTNAQSRMLEDMLLRAGVPYRIVGGTRFFDRAEIRDVMAYLTLVVNPADDIAAKRVINTPRRGIGKTTVERIEQFAREMDMTFMEGCRAWPSPTPSCVPPRAAAVGGVRRHDQRGRAVLRAATCARCIEADHRQGGPDRCACRPRTPTRRAGRVENIQEFLGVVDEFVDTHDEDAIARLRRPPR